MVTKYATGNSDPDSLDTDWFKLLYKEQMKIAQILQESGIETIHGEIKLGMVNGWSDRTRLIYEKLKEHKVDGTNTQRELGRCLNEYSFMINDGTDEYNVVYSVDSSD